MKLMLTLVTTCAQEVKVDFDLSQHVSFQALRNRSHS